VLIIRGFLGKKSAVEALRFAFVPKRCISRHDVFLLAQEKYIVIEQLVINNFFYVIRDLIMQYVAKILLSLAAERIVRQYLVDIPIRRVCVLY